ncbi:MAG: hypothetical protein K0S68_656 [Candidatus Saccharibacteria bacterium]|nr:hypothetical protein [Candidatus Saccharibacteria bacterium]
MSANTITVGLTGLGGSGKTAFALFLLELAKVKRSRGLAETSEPIVPLAELARLYLLELLDAGALNNHRANERILNRAGEWLDTVTNGFYDIPGWAFDPVYLTDHHLELLAALVADVRNNPEAYALPVTVENKSSTYRQLLTAISVPMISAASHWLGRNGRPTTNLWPAYALHRLDEQLAAHPDTPLQVLSGLRYEGDDQFIRGNRNGVLIKVDRPGLESSETQILVPDLVLINDGSLEDLREVAAEVLHRLVSGPELWPLRGQAIPFYAKRTQRV